MTLVKLNNRPVKTFDTVFNEFFNALPATWGNQSHGYNSPAVNIHETKDAWHLELSAPGNKKEDFKIQLEKGTLTISFEKQEESKSDDYKTIRREFSSTSFKRSFTVDDKINTENIQARYENGILKVYLPKKEDTTQPGKQIEIQ
jgi:HSP20 family protein